MGNRPILLGNNHINDWFRKNTKMHRSTDFVGI
jgi:hypothetical protein